MSQVIVYLGSVRFMWKISSTNLETLGLPESLSYLESDTTLERELLAPQILLYKQNLLQIPCKSKIPVFSK